MSAVALSFEGSCLSIFGRLRETPIDISECYSIACILDAFDRFVGVRQALLLSRTACGAAAVELHIALG